MVYVAAMSLLTPTESHAFQSFLTSVDYSESFIAPEWNMYGDINDTAIPQTAGKESLAKATKDLMSLDARKWSNPTRQSHSSYEDLSSHSLFPNFAIAPHTQQLLSHIKQQNQNQPQLNVLYRPHSPSSITIAPLRTISAPSPPLADDVPSSSSSPSSIPMSASPSTPLDNYPPQPLVCKRPSQDDNYISSKRPRPSHSSPSQSTSAPPTKPALLSASQKKANHIQSEQKRRANIRRGYEALCDAVPALKEAIRQEEEETCGNGNSSGKNMAGVKGKKKGRGKLPSDDGEKVDGRAGPRSENVVLQKTIDHIEGLLADRKELLVRLNIARNSLARGHPLLTSSGRELFWERQWTGGEGAADDGEDDDDE